MCNFKFLPLAHIACFLGPSFSPLYFRCTEGNASALSNAASIVHLSGDQYLSLGCISFLLTTRTFHVQTKIGYLINRRVGINIENRIKI